MKWDWNNLRGRVDDLTARHVYNIAKKRAFPSLLQWKELPRLFSSTERRIAQIASACFVVSFLLATVIFISTHQTVVPAVGGEYTEGVVGEPQFINPLFASSGTADMDLSRLVFRGLFRFDPGTGLVGDVARSYEVSEDGKVYTVHLRDDVRWHDGEILRATDVVYTMQAATDPEWKSPLAVTFRGIRVDALDDTTVRFTLPEPFAPFLATLTVGIIPEHLWQGVTPRRAALANLNLQPVGNGPYQFEKFSKDQNGSIRSYTLKRFPDFYGGTPFLDRLTFKFYESVPSMFDALNSRTVDTIGFLPADKATDVADVRGLRLLRPSIPEEIGVFWNTGRQATLKEKSVRQALDLAISREQIVADVFFGYARAIGSPLLPDAFGTSSTIPVVDVEKANATLDDAGWKRNAETQTREKNIDDDKDLEPLTFTLTTVDTPDMVALADALRKAWGEIGVEVKISVSAQATFSQEVLKPRAYDALLTGILFGVDPDPFPFWHSSQIADPGVNLAGYSNRKADAALETGRNSIDPAKRAEAYRTFETLVLEDAPALFLVQPEYLYPTSSKIQGNDMERIVNPADRFNRVEQWYIKTKKQFKLD